jgi:hypothetical protein
MVLAFDLPNNIVRLSEHLLFTTVDCYPKRNQLATFTLRIREQLEDINVYLVEREADEVTTSLAVFEIDTTFQYLPFARDHGPLNIGMVSRFGESVF